jgi:small subunit ribosomal protein S2
MLTTQQILNYGVHLGATRRNAFMKKFIYKVRVDRVHIIDANKIIERINLAGKLLSHYPSKKIAVCTRRRAAFNAAEKFAEVIGCQSFVGKFIPGTFTNPQGYEYFEPEIVIIVDPILDREALNEAFTMGYPVISLCNTNSPISKVDFVIPCNNRGRRPLAAMFYALAKSYLIHADIIKDEKEFQYKIEDFL